MNEILIINLQILSPSGFNNATEDIGYSYFSLTFLFILYL